MNETDLSEQVAFLREVEKLKSVTRANRTLDGRHENLAEHSWHVALMALLFQDHAPGATSTSASGANSKIDPARKRNQRTL